MATFDPGRITALFAQADAAATTAEKGRALEEIVCHLVGTVDGVEISYRNVLNAFETEEIDVAFWNNQWPGGLHFFPNIILAECKNWSAAVGSQEVAYFFHRLRERACTHGLLIAAQGITGSAQDLTRAHSIIAQALKDGIRILVITRSEISAIQSPLMFIQLLKNKILGLTVCGTIHGV
jgi:hypothetical protein